ncbi:MAG: hypothetical protein AAF327_08625 [Cyanobacteria bacterium P01_A01_bin.37]
MSKNPGSHQKKNLFRLFPSEKISHSTRNEISLNLLGALLLAVFLNVLANGFLNYLISNRGYFLASHKWNLLTNLEEPVDWLFLGDSSCNQGVIPEVMSDAVNATALNLCIFGPLLVFNDAWMLEQHIQQVGPPKNVVIIHVYDLWKRDIGIRSFAHLAKIPISQESLQSFTPALNPDFGQQIQWFSYRYLHLYTSSTTIADFLQKPLKSFRKGREFNVTSSGFMPKYEPNPLDVEADRIEHLDWVKGREFEISDINQRSLDAIRDLAEAHEFNVYFVASPFYDELYEERRFRRYFSQVRRGLRQYARSSDRLHVVMDNPVTFGVNQMENADHVIESAAKIYTRTIAEHITEYQSQQ